MPYVNNSGVNVYYEVAGEGLPLVFVHGYMGCVGHWFKQIPYFSKHYKVISMDRRGFYRSDAPKADKYLLPDHVSDIHAIMIQENIDKAVLIGQSMGVPIILGYCRAYPEKVIGIVSIGGISTPKHLDLLADIPRDMVNTMEGRGELLKLIFSETSRKENLMDLLMIQIEGLRSPLHGLHANIQGLYDPSFDLSDYLEKIKVPALLVVGSEDRPCPPIASKYMWDRIPNAKLEILDKTGHLPNVEMAEEFNGLMKDFLEEHIVKAVPLKKEIHYVFRGKYE